MIRSGASWPSGDARRHARVANPTAQHSPAVNNERPIERHGQTMLEVTMRHAQLAFYDDEEEEKKRSEDG
ncbi:hypothetical protein KIN20_031966 [Parelaphostrongylus tenuis]|uniref:Uncharacterized protein n=1 Tax=Parelaphostrongylus tenuis TaxID=148309 RepID=A0AAD5R5W4_PARTN|nr:hypothetical protein KIN20_031966 [Parelaphostrongylus tenuis]